MNWRQRRSMTSWSGRCRRATLASAARLIGWKGGGPVASRVSVVYSDSMTPEEMADRIRKEIREGVLGPGQPLVQDELAERFGVSRIPLREALRVVAGEGLVVLH